MVHELLAVGFIFIYKGAGWFEAVSFGRDVLVGWRLLGISRMAPFSRLSEVPVDTPFRIPSRLSLVRLRLVQKLPYALIIRLRTGRHDAGTVR